MKSKLLVLLKILMLNLSFGQDQIILRNNDTIDCKLRDIDQYYTYFIPKEAPTYVMYLKNLHIKQIINKSLRYKDSVLYVSKDTSTYTTERKIQIARYGKIKQSSATADPSKNKKTSIEVTTDKLSDNLSYFSFSTLPFTMGLGVKNESNFSHSNISNNNFALSMETIRLNSIGLQVFIGTDQYIYAAYYKPSPDQSASFFKKEAAVNFGLGPNFSIRTSQNSFVKLNTAFSASLGSTLSYSDFKLNGTTFTEQTATHEADKSNVKGKLGMDVVLSFNKQLFRGLGFSFGVGYKGRKQNYDNVGIKNVIYDRQSSNPTKIEDQVNYQFEHNLTTFLSLGAMF
jgi:hypothetical protein